MPIAFYKMFTAAASVHDPVAALVCCGVLGCLVVWFITRPKLASSIRVTCSVVGIGLIMLAPLPLLSRAYLDAYELYRVRVIVLGGDGLPVVDTVTVTCSLGGEQKAIAGGAECDIPRRNVPASGLLDVYASNASAFSTGKAELHLSGERDVVATIRLKRDLSAELRGRVENGVGKGIEGLWASVVGYEMERVQTGKGGGFVLHAHAASGQMVLLHVEGHGYGAYEGLQQAGDNAVVVWMNR